MTEKSELHTSFDGGGDVPKENRKRGFEETPSRKDSKNVHQSTPHPFTVKCSRGILYALQSHPKDNSEVTLKNCVSKIPDDSTQKKSTKINLDISPSNPVLTKPQEEFPSSDNPCFSPESPDSLKITINKVIDEFQSSILVSIEEMKKTIFQMINDEISSKL
ncbi:hypothetical protein FO519_000023 [Halicephalobus sp. NKZ332]|nr:hypothetical protein FO519_000023 [Halicephalobus sp. NKZ332]